MPSPPQTFQPPSPSGDVLDANIRADHTHWQCIAGRVPSRPDCDAINAIAAVDCRRCGMYRQMGAVAMNANRDRIGVLDLSRGDVERWFYHPVVVDARAGAAQ